MHPHHWKTLTDSDHPRRDDKISSQHEAISSLQQQVSGLEARNQAAANSAAGADEVASLTAQLTEAKQTISSYRRRLEQVRICMHDD